jgi:hypothetical protein
VELFAQHVLIAGIDEDAPKVPVCIVNGLRVI